MDCRISFICLASLVAGAAGCATTGSLDREQKLRLMVAGADCAARQSSTCTDHAQQQEIRENARKIYSQALTLSPQYLPALVGMAQLYAQMGDHDQAVVMYRRALDAAPKDAALRNQFGWYEAQCKDWDEAIAAFREACRLDPDNHQYPKTLAFTLARAGKMDESLACFKSAGLSNAEAHVKLALMLHHVGQDDLCRRHLAQAIAENPDQADARELQNQLDGAQSASASEAAGVPGFLSEPQP